jgi:hypothetical protein
MFQAGPSEGRLFSHAHKAYIDRRDNHVAAGPGLPEQQGKRKTERGRNATGHSGAS